MTPSSQARPKLTIEKSFKAGVQVVWDLWTTRRGIESWWGPDGFTVRVHALELQPGGEMVYSMSATGPDQIDYMKKAGMPLTTHHRVTWTEVVPPRRLAYRELADFIPGVQPYQVDTLIEFESLAMGSRLMMTFDAMHDDHWTRLAMLGRQAELERLARLVDS